MANNQYKTNIQNTVISKRTALKGMMDKFTSFLWCNQNSYDEYGVFILNDKDSLQFYNGPSFKNEYSKPQFGKSSYYLGTTYETQTINFRVGAYYLDEDGYQKMLNWLNPETVSNLIFDFSPLWAYHAKLSSMKDSTRYVIDRVDNKYIYYSELDLSFEIQGEPCLWGTTFYKNYNEKINIKDNDTIYLCGLEEITDTPKTKLDTSLQMNLNIPLKKPDQNKEWDSAFEVVAKAYYGKEDCTLFSVKFINLAFDPKQSIYLKYDSDRGLLFLKLGNDSGIEQLLSLTNTTDTGEKIIDSFTCNKFRIPGSLNNPNYQIFYRKKGDNGYIINNPAFYVEFWVQRKDSTGKPVKTDVINIFAEDGQSSKQGIVIAYPKTNVI